MKTENIGTPMSPPSRILSLAAGASIDCDITLTECPNPRFTEIFALKTNTLLRRRANANGCPISADVARAYDGQFAIGRRLTIS